VYYGSYSRVVSTRRYRSRVYTIILAVLSMIEDGTIISWKLDDVCAFSEMLMKIFVKLYFTIPFVVSPVAEERDIRIFEILV
jgi:hypothetical protein